MSKLIIANWKSHKKHNQVSAWFARLGDVPADVTVAIAPSFTLLSLVKAELPLPIKLAAQAVSPFPLGSYTGAVAAEQLADAGVELCLVGHSERRRYFHETDQEIAEQVARLTEQSIKPVICVDEPYLESQLSLTKDVASQAIVAYEPLTAIGTGAHASLNTVKAIVQRIRSLGYTQVIYGGSVTPELAGEYMLVCDGALVGGASLEGDEFGRLLRVASGAEPAFIS